MKNITPSKLLTFIFVIFSLLLSCNSSDNKKQQKKSLVTYRTLKYATGSNKEEYKYEDGILKSITYFNKDESIDSLRLFHSGKYFSTIIYSYYNDGTINADNYKDNKVIVHLVFDSLMNLLYERPLDLPTVLHTTYKFRSGRRYFDHNKVDTIEIINNDIPPYNKGYSISGASLTPINHLGVFTIRKFYQKNETPDSLKIWLTVSENISLEKPIRKVIDSIIIPVK